MGSVKVCYNQYMETRRCIECTEQLPIENFVINRTSRSGRAYICKKCNSIRYKRWLQTPRGIEWFESNRVRRNEQYRKYRLTEKGKKVQSEKAKRMRLKYPEKHEARQKLRYAVKVGKLKKLPCEVCGEVKVHGHHEDYSKPLEVKWLCDIHHKQIEGKLKMK